LQKPKVEPQKKRRKQRRPLLTLKKNRKRAVPKNKKTKRTKLQKPKRKPSLTPSLAPRLKREGENPILGEDLRIGRRFTETGYFEGAMDEILIYDRVLDDTEIALLYNGALTWNADTESWSGTCSE
tara:strand:+ start:914 stop:1291 length:378 start_codon:yes stop_codon:yes gene_type:complete